MATAVLLIGLLAGAYAYDSSRAERIAEGITIGGIDVGGEPVARVRRRVRAELARRVRRGVVARHGKRRFRLTPRSSRVRLDVDATVAQALSRSRSGNVATRTLRGLTGGRVAEEVQPRVEFDRGAVRRTVRRVARSIDRPARDAAVEFGRGGLRVTTSAAGLRVRQAALRRAVVAKLAGLDGGREVAIAVRRTAPKRGTRELARRYPTLLSVDRPAFRLTLYKRLKRVRTYTIAIGQAGYDTPAGKYTIQNKTVDPVWSVPLSAWTGALAGRSIPPGPSNPLKARWLGIYDGVGIHGTDELSSLGTAASRGCLRMAIPEVIELYDMVPVGTPIYIV